MVLNRTLVISSLAVLAMIASATTFDAVTLKRNAKAGETNTYTLNVDLSVEGIGELEVTADIIDEVTKVGKDGSLVISSKTSNQVVMMGGSPIQESHEVEVSSTTYSKSGEIVKIEGTTVDSEAYRFASLMNFMWPTKPIDVGSKWNVKTKANSERGTGDMSFSFTVVERVKLHGYDCFKIKFVNKETSGGDASTEGHTWIDVKSGLVIKNDGDMYGIPMQGMVIDGHFTVELDN